ncbi:enediyne antibiotic chromoprotein [Streptomyces sp. NPDC014734]|uniref:enediyne antibiotic chromoprotein n=1 Tax=Streptomyces sp. NPDC014734 TaxID=3364886 RepID=UPI003701E1C8
MSVKTKAGLLVRAGATAAVAIGLAVGLQSSAMAAPAVSVTPASGLTDGATVTLTATGLTPGTVYHVGQCSYVETDVAACNPATSVDVAADASGKVTAQVKVFAKFDAVTGAEAKPWGTVDCNSRTCAVGLGSDKGEGGAQNISFS